MKPPRFDYHDPATVEETLALLARHGDGARVLAGGQSLMPMLNFRLARPAHVIDLNRVAGLDAIAGAEDGGLDIGALARQRALERSGLVAARCPLMAQAMPLVGHSQIRARGTLGGSLAHADPAAELPAVAVALDARLTLASARGRRTVAAEDFFVAALTTSLAPDEILTGVSFPPWPARTGASVLEVAIRRGDFALGGVAATLTLDERGRVGAARIVCFGVGPRPARATSGGGEPRRGHTVAAGVRRGGPARRRRRGPRRGHPRERGLPQAPRRRADRAGPHRVARGDRRRLRSMTSVSVGGSHRAPPETSA